MNVYRDFNIGTAKPTISEMDDVRHHLINVVDSDKTFSVGDYKELAMPIINRLHNEGKIPVICGGTGFYINSLIYDMSYGNTKENLKSELGLGLGGRSNRQNSSFLNMSQDNERKGALGGRRNEIMGLLDNKTSKFDPRNNKLTPFQQKARKISESPNRGLGRGSFSTKNSYQTNDKFSKLFDKPSTKEKVKKEEKSEEEDESEDEM